MCLSERQFRCTTAQARGEWGWAAMRGHNQGNVTVSCLLAFWFQKTLITQTTHWRRPEGQAAQVWSVTLCVTFLVVLLSLLCLCHRACRGATKGQQYYHSESCRPAPPSAVFTSLVWDGTNETPKGQSKYHGNLLIPILPQQPLQLYTTPMFRGPECIPSHAVTSPEYIG